METKISAIIADDHPVMRQGLRQIIERDEFFEVLVECGDGETALNETLMRQPDVVILDIDMPHKTGLEVLQALREQSFAGKVILMTVHDDEEFFNEALRCGANGYVLKDSATEDILNAVRTVVSGQNYVSPALTNLLFQQKQKPPVELSGLENLTPTERQILKLVSEYQTNNQIAETLFISPATVKTHRRNINLKLALEGNHALMKFAVEHKSKL